MSKIVVSSAKNCSVFLTQFTKTCARKNCRFVTSWTLSKNVNLPFVPLKQVRHYGKDNKSNETDSSVSIDKMVDDELAKYDIEDLTGIASEKLDKPAVAPKPLPISTERGKTGVFDIEEFVTLLRSENVKDICVIEVEKSLKFVDYMVIGTCRSSRHIYATGQFVNRMYKHKRGDKDSNLKLEGHQRTSDWLAFDTGNIAAHLFLPEKRKYYDLESLWSLGPENDPLNQTEVVSMTSFGEEFLQVLKERNIIPHDSEPQALDAKTQG